MKGKYAFPASGYNEHLEKHRMFMELFLLPLTTEIRRKRQGDYDPNMLEDIAKQGLADTARW